MKAVGIVGLDLSLRAPAAVYLPPDWDGGDLLKVVVSKLGSEEREVPADELAQVLRMCAIADAVVEFVRKSRARLVAAESYAFGARSSSAHRLAELGGIVRARLAEGLGIEVVPIVASGARKTLLQKLPRADVKAFVEANMRRLGGETFYWSGDVVDGFVVANHVRMVRGLPHMSFPGLPLSEIGGASKKRR